MLHSAMPRAAYLAGYHHPQLAGYYEELNPYAYLQPRLDEAAYAQRVFAWEQQQQQHRAATPCPLDLSLKASASALSSPTSQLHDEDEVVVDDEERQSNRYATTLLLGDEDVIVDDADSQRSCSSAHSSTYHLQQQQQQQLAFERTPKKIDLMGGGGFGFTEQQRLGYPTTPPQQQQLHAPMTPPSTPSPPQQCLKRKDSPSTKHQEGKPPRAKKKHVRKLKFDEETSSPVSGTVILGPDEAIVTGDIDPAFNIVEVTEEARAELAKIENRLGPYQCKLCRHMHEDAFQLARHRCSRIAHVEYRCPECDKRFSCPANLASHRRWHKPRPAAGDAEFACTRCDAKFGKNAALKRHVQQQHAEQNNNEEGEEEDAKKRSAAGEADLA